MIARFPIPANRLIGGDVRRQLALPCCPFTTMIQYWNPGMTELFGFSEYEAIGATLDLIVPPDYRERHWIGYCTAMDLADGVVDHGSFNVPALHKDGRTLRLEVHLNVIHDSRSRVVGAFAAFSPDEGPSDSIEPL